MKNLNKILNKNQKLANIVRVLMENESFLLSLRGYNEQEVINGLKPIAEQILEEIE